MSDAQTADFSLDDLMGATDELGRAKIQAAAQVLLARKLQGENEQLRRELAEAVNAKNGSPVRAA